MFELQKISKPLDERKKVARAVKNNKLSEQEELAEKESVTPRTSLKENLGLKDEEKLVAEEQAAEEQAAPLLEIEELPAEYLVPPDPLEVRRGESRGGQNEKRTYPRYRLTLEVLKDMGVDFTECRAYKGAVDPERMRGKSYIMIVATPIDRCILVCEEEGNRTFVIYNAEDPKKYGGMTKQELLSLKGSETQDLCWYTEEFWKRRLGTLLNFPDAEKANEMVNWKEYFKNTDYIQHDLEAFAKVAGVPIEKINTGNIRDKHIHCVSGERVHGLKYMRRAAVALGFAQTHSEASIKRSIIEHLKSLIV